MPQAILLWTPFRGSNSLSQNVQYKLASSADWITAAVVGEAIDTYTISGLLANSIYDYRIQDNCSLGGPTNSGQDHKITFSCPLLTITSGYNDVTASFNIAPLGSITKINIELLQDNGTTVIATESILNPTSATYNKTFAGLSPSTNYKLRSVMFAGDSFNYSNVCATQSFVTTAAPQCGAPTNLTVTQS